MIEFTDEQKIRAFNELSKCYYERNFGTLSKSEVDLAFFQVFMEYGGDSLDEYSISKELGITKAKVRNMKQRWFLKRNTDSEWWKERFIEDLKNAHYDPDSKLVKMNIDDINVLNELRYFVTKQGWFDEYHLNPGLFQCPLEGFVVLCKNLDECNDETIKNALLEFNKVNKDENGAIVKMAKESFREGLKEFLMVASKESIINLINVLPFGGLAGTAIKAVGRLIESK